MTTAAQRAFATPVATAGTTSPLRSVRRSTAAPLLFLALAGAGWGCTTVNATAVKDQRSAGVTRNYARPPAELYQAAVLGLESLREDPNWRDLEITDRDPAKGYVIAERDLDSAVIPGLGERDAIGVFVADDDGDSSVTVVRMSSDQMPGSVGTSVNSARDASGLIFPAIDAALATIPEQPRPKVAAAPASVAPSTGAPPPVAPGTTGGTTGGARTAAPEPATAAPLAAGATAAPSASTLDRVYATLRAGGTWRPLVREIAADGEDEIRIGTWVSLTAVGDHVRMRVKSKDGSPVDAARLAVELERAGFHVDVEAAGRR